MDGQQILQCMPNCPNPDGWAEALNEAMPWGGIDTPLEQAAFIAQIGHESSDLRAITENLNYSADALSKMFGKYFPGDLEAQYARKPEKIANRIYANRMGNGPESSGDGWAFRGHGPIQLTGRDNHTLFAQETGIDVIHHPELWDQPRTGAFSAAWWWKRNQATRYAADVDATSRLVNLGSATSKGIPHGLDDRRQRFTKAREVLGA